MVSPYAPPPATVPGGGRAIAVDVEAVDARLVFDVAARRARCEATVTFVVDGPSGYPALDLRQPVETVAVDGRPLHPGSFAHVDLGGGPGSQMRVLDDLVEPGGRHRLEVTYQLGTPDTTGAEPVGWGDGGVRFDLWMSDLEPGRYLEMWIPAPLCHDRFALSVDVEVTGTDRPHLLVTNAGPPPSVDRRWSVRYPATFTSLSPMLVLAPADEVEWRRRTVALPGRSEPIELRSARHLDVDADLGACEADVAAWMPYLAARYGPWAHGPAMTAFIWGPGRGMEYDGATTAAVGALEHEVFHSWFGRGVKPARASDGWIDEAWTSWATASRRREGPRFDATELGLDEEPVLLYPPHPWSRHTPRPSYAEGARLFSGLAALLGGADRLRSAMAAWYAANAGGLVTTDGLEAHLRSWSGVDIGPWWDRYVHGRS
jgi:hypothetical protein